MDYEKKYKEALEDMRVIYPNLKGDAKLAVEHAFPELTKSEDERIRKFLLEYSIEMIAGLESDISISVYDGVKGHDPEAEEELEKWRKARVWLEKQKEQEPNKQTEIEIEEAAEKAALEFAYQHPLENGEYGVAKISFMRGAEWQRQQGIVWSEKDEEKKAYDKGFKAAEEFYCGRII